MIAVIDEDLPRALKPALERGGWAVIDIRETALRGSPDEKVFRFAQNKKAVLFSGDLGFANIIRFPVGSHSGLVILRLPNELSTQSLVNITLKALSKLKIQDIQGNLIIIEPGNIRVRKE